MENKIFMKLIEEKQKINSKINIEIKSIHRRENMTECTLIEKRLSYEKKKDTGGRHRRSNIILTIRKRRSRNKTE